MHFMMLITFIRSTPVDRSSVDGIIPIDFETMKSSNLNLQRVQQINNLSASDNRQA